MSAARPHLEFVGAIFGAVLGARHRAQNQQQNRDENSHLVDHKLARYRKPPTITNRSSSRTVMKSEPCRPLRNVRLAPTRANRHSAAIRGVTSLQLYECQGDFMALGAYCRHCLSLRLPGTGVQKFSLYHWLTIRCTVSVVTISRRSFRFLQY